jgi:hypothetical protein
MHFCQNIKILSRGPDPLSPDGVVTSKSVNGFDAEFDFDKP